MTTTKAEAFKVLFISGIGGDTRRYRCIHQQEQLALKGVPTSLREDDDPQLLTDVFDYDVFILHRVPFSPLVGLIIELAHAQGKPVIFDTDDLVFDPELYAHIGLVDTLPPEVARRFRADLARLEETFQHCDCVLTTTEFLAEEARRRGKPAYVNRNAPNAEMFRISEQAWAERQRRLEESNAARPVVIGYFSGTASHNRDFQTITEPLVWVMSTYPWVWLHIGGYLELSPAFEPLRSRIRRTPYMTWRELPHVIAQADINLVPLETDNPFCQAKSEIKFVEAALVGVPTVASRAEAYEYAIAHGRNGLLVNSPDEWREALQMLLDHPQRRREMGEAARRTVYARYTPERRAEELWATLSDIRQQYGGPPANKNELWHIFIAGVERYASEIQQQIREQEEQIKGLRQAMRSYEAGLMRAEQRIADLEQTIEAIMQGRVMRLLTSLQRLWRRAAGRNIQG
ncbi:MAG TPA: glycosyltransferase family 4 protein [Thermoflexia bacterium]|jgi:glycosyltransferase involved in cell wall biosynthesis|nr:glycosyltransferase family 4 protein [Thermoflexia bacterium]